MPTLIAVLHVLDVGVARLIWLIDYGIVLSLLTMITLLCSAPRHGLHYDLMSHSYMFVFARNVAQCCDGCQVYTTYSL